ncbi:uncharacterized protein LOC128862928 isoform X4 [Anastrepha ludens]|uniref:uncharacterized protein LOC128862928 isoform X4 n=1 Tax=Anastrepha ludens TaxID=28586 RepID=UPI0023AEECEE|nr:uncharacterized protein LOC128862928 isoform X4 [Anastrepha ludens]
MELGKKRFAFFALGYFERCFKVAVAVLFTIQVLFKRENIRRSYNVWLWDKSAKHFYALPTNYKQNL